MTTVLSFRSRRVSPDFDVFQQMELPLERVVLVKHPGESKIGLLMESECDGATSVRTVHPGGLAERAGFIVGDVIAAIDGIPVKGAKHATRLFSEAETVVEVAIRRQPDRAQRTPLQCL